MDYLKNSGHAVSKFRATNSMGYNRVSMLKCTSFRDFQTKNYFERGTIKKSKKPGKDNLFSFSGKRRGS